MSWPKPFGGGSAVPGDGILSSTVPFATAIPLDGNKRMPPTQVTGALTFTVADSPAAAAGGTCTLKLTSNGANTPAFPGIHWGGSSGWVNTAGTVNIVTIWNDGDQTYHSIAQHQSAPVTIPNLTSALKSGASSPATLALTMSAALGNSGAVDASQFAVSTTNSGSQQTDNVLSASASGAVLTLSLSRAATVGDTTTVSYTPSATLAGRLVDAAGNPLYWMVDAPVLVQTFAGMLDVVGVAATGAWSLRRLTTAYAGPLIRVTGSVQGQFDVFSNAATGDLDMTRLTGAGGETYSLNTVYDQSGGGRNLAVSGANVRVEITGGPKTGLPVRIFINAGGRIEFTGTSLEAVYLSNSREGSAFLAATLNNGSPFAGLAGGSTGSAAGWGMQPTVGNTPGLYAGRAWGPTFFSGGAPAFVFQGYSLITTNANAMALRSTVSAGGVRSTTTLATGTASANAPSLTRWGMAVTDGTNSPLMSYLEMIQFNSDVGTAVRDAIEDAQRIYWGY